MGHLGVNDMQECKYAVTLPAYLPRLFPLLLSLYSSPPTVLHCRSLHCHSLALSLLLYVAQLLRPTLSVTPNSLTVTLNCCHSLDIPGFVTPKRCHFLPCSIMASQSVVAFVLVVHGFPFNLMKL